MKIYKNCDGKKIDKCRKCEHIYHFMFVDWCTIKAPDEQSRKIKNIEAIPLWCSLGNYKEGKV